MLIHARGGRSTLARVRVLEQLLTTPHPLAHDEIAAALKAAEFACNRVTLYRTLDWLSEQGLIRRIAGSDRAWRFEAIDEAEHLHAHFHCERCDRISCLDDVSPDIMPPLPQGYQFERAELVFHGICPDCGAKHVDSDKAGK